MSRRLTGAIAGALAVLTVAAPAYADPPQPQSPEAAREARIQRFDSRREAEKARKEAEAARLREQEKTAAAPDAGKPDVDKAAAKPATPKPN